MASIDNRGRYQVTVKNRPDLHLTFPHNRLADLEAYIDFDAQTAYLAETKNGRPRRLSLRSDLLGLLRELPRDSAKVFPISVDALAGAWAKARYPDAHAVCAPVLCATRKEAGRVLQDRGALSPASGTEDPRTRRSGATGRRRAGGIDAGYRPGAGWARKRQPARKNTQSGRGIECSAPASAGAARPANRRVTADRSILAHRF